MPARARRTGQHRDYKGQSLAELALVMPILLLVLLGAIDLGRVFYYQVAITDAAREGVRVGSLPARTDGEIRSAVRNEVSSTFSIPDGNIAIDPPAVRVSGQPVTVTVSYDFTALTPVIDRMMGGQPAQLTRSAAAVVQ